jgi:Mn-dependent DtxR family transcriptional regulator
MDSIGKSREDYLEAILMQIKKNGACRLTDVASKLGFSKPSASVAVKKLEEEGYIIKDDWKIVLTDKGMSIAKNLYDRHTFFTSLLIEAGVEAGVAEDQACLMEHGISDDSFKKLRKYLEDKVK